MSEKVLRFCDRFVHDESGQGITEYGAILAFVALLVGVAFGFQSQLRGAISNAFSQIVAQLNAITSQS